MFEDLEFGLRRPTEKEIKEALDDSDLPEDRRWLVLELASPAQLSRIKRNRVSSDGYVRSYEPLDQEPAEFLDERFKDD